MNDDTGASEGRSPAWESSPPHLPPPGRPTPPTWTAPPQGSADRGDGQPSTLGVVALVAGLAGLAIALGPRIFAVFGLAAGLTATVIGVIATVRRHGRGMAIAGLVLGVLSVLVTSWSMAEMDRSLQQIDRGVRNF